jgi:anti-sigma B factor antagonist
LTEKLVGLDIDEGGEVVIARVTGELDIAEAAVTGDAIAEAIPSSARALVVDFSRLAFIDSSGISMLFQLVRHVSARRQLLRVVAIPGEAVARVLEIVEFESAAPVHASLDEAIASLDPAA